MIEEQAKCPACEGTGKRRVELDRCSEWETCTICRGTGQVTRKLRSHDEASSSPAHGLANPGWRERAVVKHEKALKLVETIEAEASTWTTEAVEAKLASLVAWKGAVVKSKARTPNDRRSLLVDIMYLEAVVGSGEDSPNIILGDKCRF